MKMKIGFLLSLLVGQQVAALEITQTLTPVEIARAVIVADKLEDAHELLARCSVKERTEVAQVLAQRMLDWVATLGSRDEYAYILTGHHQKQAVAAKILCGACVGLALGFVGIASYKYAQSKYLALKSVDNLYGMHKVTNPDWMGRSGVVNGVPLTSPYFVDGYELARLFESIPEVLNSFKPIETALEVAGQCSLMAVMFDFASKNASDSQYTAQQNLDRYDRMQALVKHLEK